MNYDMLEKLLEKEDVDIKKIWKFFGAENKEGMIEIIIKNFKEAKLSPDNGFIYSAPDVIYDGSMNNNYNIYYEKILVISFFLKGFAQYEDVVTEAFIKSIGALNFILTFESIFKDNFYYIFFKDSFKEYKQDKYFREQTDRLLEVFNEIGKEFENINLKETKEILEQIQGITEK